MTMCIVFLSSVEPNARRAFWDNDWITVKFSYFFQGGVSLLHTVSGVQTALCCCHSWKQWEDSSFPVRTFSQHLFMRCILICGDCNLGSELIEYESAFKLIKDKTNELTGLFPTVATRGGGAWKIAAYAWVFFGIESYLVCIEYDIDNDRLLQWAIPKIRRFLSHPNNRCVGRHISFNDDRCSQRLQMWTRANPVIA